MRRQRLGHTSPRPSHLFTSLLLAGGLVVAGSGCDSDSAAPEERVAVIGTYNVGLAVGFVPFSDQRRSLVAALTAELDADVLCLQEVWYQHDIDAFVNAAAETFPHAHYELLTDTETGPPACELDATTIALRDCVDAECGDTPPGELSDCVTGQCGDEFQAIAPGCIGCLAANIGKEADEIFEICTTGDTLFSFDGTNGLLMLSRHPMTNRIHLKLDSWLTQRSVIGATVTLPRLGAVDISCTHIAADLSGTLAYNGPYASYGEENTEQMRAILEFMDTAGSGASVRFATGDFNSGPAGDGIAAELPEAAYKLLVDAGWVSLNLGLGECTYCPDNLLNSDTFVGRIIDHIFAQGLPSTFRTSARRIGTETVTVESQGEQVTTHPSDHFGVLVQFDYVP